MKNWINKTKTVVTTAALCFALLGSGVESWSQSNEIYVKQPIGLTQYVTPEPTGVVSDTEWNQQGETQGTDELNYTSEFIDEEILYNSYYSYGAGCFSVELIKEDLEVTTNGAVAASMGNSGIVSSKELLDACLSEVEKAELESGIDKEIRVTMKQMVAEGLSEKQHELLEQATTEYTETYKGFQIGSYIKISIAKKNEEGKWKKIKNLNNDIKFVIDIPPISQNKEAKEYYLLQIRNGEYSITEDEDQYMEILTTSVSGPAMCVIGYTLPHVEVTPTVEPTAPLTYWEHMMSGGFCVWHWFILSLLFIGFTWLLAIDSKKIRIVFLSVMSILCLLLAILGQCIYDWIAMVGSIIIMILIHIGRTYYKRHKKRK